MKIFTYSEARQNLANIAVGSGGRSGDSQKRRFYILPDRKKDGKEIAF